MGATERRYEQTAGKTRRRSDDGSHSGRTVPRGPEFRERLASHVPIGACSPEGTERLSRSPVEPRTPSRSSRPSGGGPSVLCPRGRDRRSARWQQLHGHRKIVALSGKDGETRPGKRAMKITICHVRPAGHGVRQRRKVPRVMVARRQTPWPPHRPIVTVAAEHGAGGDLVAPRVADALGVPFLDRALPASLAAAARSPSGRAASSAAWRGPRRCSRASRSSAWTSTRGACAPSLPSSWPGRRPTAAWSSAAAGWSCSPTRRPLCTCS